MNWTTNSPLLRCCLLFLTFLFIVFRNITCYAQNDTTDIVLSSGLPGKPYYDNGQIVADILNKAFKKIKVRNSSSSGSSENFLRLSNNTADLIVAQRDIVLEKYYDKENPIRNFEIVMPLFPEALQIFVRHQNGVISFQQFKRMVENNEIPKIAIGPKGSSSNQATRNLFNLLGLKISEERFDERAETETFPDFSNDASPLDAIVFFAATPINLIKNTKIDSVAVISCSNNELRRFLPHFKYLDKIEVVASSYPFLHTNDTINTIGTWAFLIANSNLKNDFQESATMSLPTIILKEVMNANQDNPIYHTYNGLEFATDTSNKKIQVTFLKSNPILFFKGLPLSSDFMTLINYSEIRKDLFVGCVLSLIIAGFIYFCYSKWSVVGIYWYQYRQWPIVIIVSLLLYMLCIGLIKVFEQQFYESSTIRSSMLNLSWLDIFKWLTLAKFANHEGGVFPLSAGGQIIATIAFYQSWINIGAAIVFQIFRNSKINRKKMGIQQLNLKDHYIICGWNDKTPALITGILEASKSYKNDKNAAILLITEKINNVEELGAFFENHIQSGRFNFIKGEAREDRIFIMACIEKAKSVIIVSENKGKEADERNLLRAMAISRYCRKKSEKFIDNIHIIAEINDVEYKEAFLDADVDEVICSGEVTTKLLIQGTFNHGVSDVIESVLTYDKGSEIYFMPLKDYPVFIGRTFDNLLSHLREDEILLIGIKLNSHDKDGNEIRDRDIAKNSIAYEKFGKTYLINPIKAERHYQVTSRDCLCVIAETEKHMEVLKTKNYN